MSTKSDREIAASVLNPETAAIGLKALIFHADPFRKRDDYAASIQVLEEAVTKAGGKYAKVTVDGADIMTAVYYYKELWLELSAMMEGRS